MILAVFIQKTAEVLREHNDEKLRKRAMRNHHEKFDKHPTPDLATVCDGILDLDWKEMQLCVFVLFFWENQNINSRLECTKGLNKIIRNDRFHSMAKAIRRGDV